MLFSIITINFNNKKGLLNTLQSIENQIFTDFEHIIIDGNSNDGSLDILFDLKDNNVKWISENDNGIYNAMNKGIRMASGKIIGILNAGDRYYPNALKIINKYQKKYKNTDKAKIDDPKM